MCHNFSADLNWLIQFCEMGLLFVQWKFDWLFPSSTNFFFKIKRKCRITWPLSPWTRVPLLTGTATDPLPRLSSSCFQSKSVAENDLKDFIIIKIDANYANKFLLIFWGQLVLILGILGIIGREVGLMISKITETRFGIIWLLRITKMYFVLQALVSSYCWLCFLACLFSFYLFSNMITLGHNKELYAD